jgi:hypothetical protein
VASVDLSRLGGGVGADPARLARPICSAASVASRPAGEPNPPALALARGKDWPLTLFSQASP